MIDPSCLANEERLRRASLDAEPPGWREAPEEFLTQNPDVRATLELARTIAASDATVLIEGESGSGKELLARLIHRCSARGHRPLVSVNCAALPAGLLESELFGHERGAFTGALARVIGRFELARGSTILLDEIGELELRLQAKLLRVIQEKQVERLGARAPVDVDFRLVATTHRSLAGDVRAGRFRGDLYHRLNVLPIRLPPLRERIGDVRFLCRRFLERQARLGRAIPELAPDALEALESYAWPGNVRELQNLLERLTLVRPGARLQRRDLGLEEAPFAPRREAEGPLRPLRRLRDMERWMIVEALRRLDGNRTHASRELGISLRTLRNKIHEHRITEPDTRPRHGIARPPHARPHSGGPLAPPL